MHSILTDNLESYLEGRLPQAVERSLEDHLAGCAACREAADEARQASRWLRALASTDAPQPSQGFYLKVRDGIESARGFSLWGLLFPAFRQLAFVTLMLVVLLATYYLSLSSTEYGATPILVVHPQLERETPVMQADEHANREHVMMALATARAGD